MKTKLVCPILILAGTLTGICYELPDLDKDHPILEEFSSPTLDETHFYEYSNTKATLVPTLVVVKTNPLVEEMKLSLAIPTVTSEDFVSAELRTAYPGYYQSWQMTLDLVNISNAGKKAGCGFMIFNEGDRKDRLFVDFYGISGIRTGLFVNSQEVPKGSLSANVGVPKVSVRVRFDATTKLMAFAISLKDKQEGYKWIKIGTFSPTGKGGSVRGNWRMKPDGQFGIQLSGFGRSQKIRAGKITLDNLAVSLIP